jgi:protein SCO1/2
MPKVRSPKALQADGSTPETTIAAIVDSVRDGNRDRTVLIELLRERHPLYAGRSTNATIRIRGYVMAAFETVGLPDAALSSVVEELESGRDPFVVAAAARALRGLDGRERRVVPFLLRAIENLLHNDDTITFETYLPTWPVAAPTTALAEIFGTLAWLGSTAEFALPQLVALQGTADEMPAVTRAALARAIGAVQADDGFADETTCCNIGEPVHGSKNGPRRNDSPPMAARFQDQDGRTASYADLFTGQTSVVVFFYTRCSNPNKCSLTITKLARLQRAVVDADLTGRVRTAAITYDPEFDSSARLRAYGENRGVLFDGENRFLRNTMGFRRLSSYFDLGVNYGPALVNRHRIEAFILDPAARITSRFLRLQWDPAEVLREARQLAG